MTVAPEAMLALSERLAPELAVPLAPVGGFGRLSWPRRGRGGDAGNFVIHARDGSPVAVLRREPRAADPVGPEALRVRHVLARIGPGLGEAVLPPLAAGEDDAGRWTVYPLCPSLGGARWRGRASRAWLAPQALQWLREVNRLTRSEVDAARLEEDFHRPLGWLMTDSRFPSPLRRLARCYRERLEAGSWRPYQVLAHNEITPDNLQLLPRRPWWQERAPAARFALADWRRSQPRHGHPFVDLLRLGQALELSPRGLARELRAHAGALDCAPDEAWGYLLAVLGQRGKQSAEGSAPGTYEALRRRLCLELAAALQEEPLGRVWTAVRAATRLLDRARGRRAA